jgi:hypothetical protein
LAIKYLYRFLLFIPLLTLTGCFDIIEEVNLNEDGSGLFSLTVNMSQSKAKLITALLLDSVDGHKVPKKEEIRKVINDIATAAQKTEGIKDVKTVQDFDNFIFSFKCSFTNLNAMNNLIEEIKKANHAGEFLNSGTKHFEFDKKTNVYTRHGHYSIGKEYAKIKAMDKSILNNAAFISISRFNKEVINTANINAKISPTKKAVMLRVNVAHIIKGTENFSNKITLAK